MKQRRSTVFYMLSDMKGPVKVLTGFLGTITALMVMIFGAIGARKALDAGTFPALAGNLTTWQSAVIYLGWGLLVITALALIAAVVVAITSWVISARRRARETTD